MRLVLMHLDDEPRGLLEEAAFLVPGGDRSVIMAPLAALDQLVPLLLEGMADLPEQRCDGCGELLAELPPADGRIL